MNRGGKIKDKIEVVPLHLMSHLNGYSISPQVSLISPNPELSCNKQSYTTLAANKAWYLAKLSWTLCNTVHCIQQFILGSKKFPGEIWQQMDLSSISRISVCLGICET